MLYEFVYLSHHTRLTCMYVYIIAYLSRCLFGMA